MPDSPESIENLDQLTAQALVELEGISDSQTLEQWHTTYLGRKGKVTLSVRRVGELPKEERPAFGQHANRVKQQLESAYEERARFIKAQEMEKSLSEGAVDVTLPGRPVLRGRLHPSTQTLRRILQIWADMGFQVYRSRDVETDEYNFQLLNFPPHHPARDMQDTFYTTQPDVLLRTHTSPGQIHAMR
ncbi:MAG: phenylalanine--tRNA ligase subunit alpha, partial [Anaerolineae bacterium]